jgi:BarA-like signal transduction histidine kinase
MAAGLAGRHDAGIQRDSTAANDGKVILADTSIWQEHSRAASFQPKRPIDVGPDSALTL